jgi:hypothetical protein
LKNVKKRRKTAFFGFLRVFRGVLGGFKDGGRGCRGWFSGWGGFKNLTNLCGFWRLGAENDPKNNPGLGRVLIG